MESKRNNDSIIAAAVTFAVALAILLFLFFGGMSFDRQLLAESSTPEIAPEEEELFIEPEILRDLGEPDAVNHDAPAPAFKGEPEPSETDNTKLVVPDKNPKPAPPIEKPITQTKESPVKATTPSVSDEEKQKVTSSVAKGFSGRNGASEGKDGVNGAGGSGTGVAGTASGRTFLNCPRPDVTLQHKTVVKVNVVIDQDGNVISASAAGAAASAEIRKKCEQAAKGAKWSPKKGAGETRGSITFTITPR